MGSRYIEVFKGHVADMEVRSLKLTDRYSVPKSTGYECSWCNV